VASRSTGAAGRRLQQGTGRPAPCNQLQHWSRTGNRSSYSAGLGDAGDRAFGTRNKLQQWQQIRHVAAGCDGRLQQPQCRARKRTSTWCSMTRTEVTAAANFVSTGRCRRHGLVTVKDSRRAAAIAAAAHTAAAVQHNAFTPAHLNGAACQAVSGIIIWLPCIGHRRHWFMHVHGLSKSSASGFMVCSVHASSDSRNSLMYFRCARG
jgi:hypothetical protein